MPSPLTLMPVQQFEEGGFNHTSYKTYRIVIHTCIKYRDTYRLWKKCIVTPLVPVTQFPNENDSLFSKY
jgi:hypothetical protein